MTKFMVGDRVRCINVVNESWNPDYTATVTAVYEGGFGEYIDVRWDHGPSNAAHFAEDFALR